MQLDRTGETVCLRENCYCWSNLFCVRAMRMRNSPIVEKFTMTSLDGLCFCSIWMDFIGISWPTDEWTARLHAGLFTFYFLFQILRRYTRRRTAILVLFHPILNGITWNKSFEVENEERALITKKNHLQTGENFSENTSDGRLGERARANVYACVCICVTDRIDWIGNRNRCKMLKSERAGCD